MLVDFANLLTKRISLLSLVHVLGCGGNCARAADEENEEVSRDQEENGNCNAAAPIDKDDPR